MQENEQNKRVSVVDFPKKKYPIKLPLHIARAEISDIDIGYVLSTFGLSLDDYIEIRKNPYFISEVESYKDRLSSVEGTEFRETARTLAVEFLPDMYHIMKDPDVAPSTKVKLFSEISALADFDPRTKASGSGPSGPKVNIQINLGQEDIKIKQETQRTVDMETDTNDKNSE